MPRTRLKSGLRVGRLPAIMPVLHSVLDTVSNIQGEESVNHLHDPDCEVGVIPEEISITAVVG